MRNASSDWPTIGEQMYFARGPNDRNQLHLLSYLSALLFFVTPLELLFCFRFLGTSLFGPGKDIPLRSVAPRPTLADPTLVVKKDLLFLIHIDASSFQRKDLFAGSYL
jgi:hypothetical protein